MRSRGKARAARKCEGCGARVRTEAKFCEYCGAELPGREAPEPATPSRFGDVDARFAALREHPSTPRLMQRTPSTTGTMGGMIAGVVVGLVFAGFAIFFMSSALSSHREFERKWNEFPGHLDLPRQSGPNALLLIVPGVFICVGAGISIWSLVRIATFTNAPLRRRPALVVGERTRVSGGGQNSSASTSYFVSFEFEDGRRREFRTRGRVVGEVTEGDIGIAYLKDKHLLDFARVPV